MSGVTNLDKNKLSTQLATVSKFQDAVNTLGATFDKATVKEKLIQLLKNNDVNSDVLGILNDFVNLDQFLTVVCESKADLFLQQTDKEAVVAKLKETLEKEAHFTKKLDDEVKEVVEALLKVEVDKLELTPAEKTQVETELTETLKKEKLTETLEKTVQTAKETVDAETEAQATQNSTQKEAPKPTQNTTEEKETKGTNTKEVLVYVCLVLLVLFSTVGTVLYVKKQNK
ncbi:hypothetical protein ACMBCQ_02525 [Candidatus Phytoplasma citri]